jgi:hypothetical protein
MEFSKLRGLLKNNGKCYPFNDKYDPEEIISYVNNSLSKEELENDVLKETLFVINFLNNHYKEYYNYLKANILKSNIKFDKLVDLLFAVFNRNYLVLIKQGLVRFTGKKEIHERDLFSHKVQTLDSTMDKVEASSALEAEIDAMNFVLNYLRYFIDKEMEIDPNLPSLHPIEIAKRIAFSGSFYSILKEEYDNSIWNFGYWKYKKDGVKPVMNIVSPDHEMLILNKIGLIRLQRSVSTNSFSLLRAVNQQTPYGIYMIELAKINKHEKRIKDVWVENGVIKYKLAKGFGKNETSRILRNLSAYVSYYNFLTNVKLTKLHNLEITDLISLFSLLQDLIEHASNLEFDDSIQSTNDLMKFPIKILRNDLYNYFVQRTIFSNEQLKSFTELIASNFGDRVNLWDKPLVKYNDTFYVNYLPTLNPILLNLMDHWIEEGGYSLDGRGKLLEKYMTDTMNRILTKKKLQFFIPHSNKITNGTKKYEEIDLIINLKSVVLVAEIKCIKFPMECRDKHNATGTLKKAAQQIRRKVDFLINNAKEVETQIGSINGKEIIPLVITNYPIYSEYQIDEIPITDFYLFESFFRSGKITRGNIFNGLETEIIDEHYYYNNEDEMNQELKKFFKKSYPIQELRKLYEIKDMRLTTANAPYEIYATSAQIKDEQ